MRETGRTKRNNHIRITEIVGRMDFIGLDPEGNIHIIISKKGMGAEKFVKFLKYYEGYILRFIIED